LRPTLGIQLAPPTLGCSAYLSITSGPPDLIAQMLLGYGVFQALLLIRYFPESSGNPSPPRAGRSPSAPSTVQLLVRGRLLPPRFCRPRKNPASRAPGLIE